MARVTMALFALLVPSIAVGQVVGGSGRAAPIRLADREIVHLGSEVSVEVDARTRVARFEIQERFQNLGGRLMEADYLYPVPAGAVFTNLSLFVGETELRGEMLPAEQARAIYEEIVRQRKDPALVELVGHGLVRTRVFPIEPGQIRKIILRYTQVLPREGELLRLTYPRTRSALIPVSPIVRPVVPEVAERPGSRGAFAPGGATMPLRVVVRVTGAEAIGDPVSPTHAVDTSRPAVNELEVRTEARADGDFELLLPLRRAEVGASLLVHSPDPSREAGYFLLLVTPPPHANGAGIPRDLTLVLDVSGSMSGHKLAQARAALRQLLRGLEPADRFRLIAFASVVRGWREGWSHAEPPAVAEAIEWLDALAADGSTNIHDALARALEPEVAPERLSQVLFLTDGLPTVAETDPERIALAAARLRDGERVFAFGVGEDVNTYLLDRLAEGGRGAVSYVAANENVEEAIGSLARKIGAPALADLRVERAPVALEELYPAPLPDLFHGEELMLLGRYRDGAAGTLVLTGERNGRSARFEFDLDFARRTPANDFLPRLWASRKAGALTSHLRLHGHDAETLEELRELGLRYGILTEYTAYLVEEPGMSRDQVAERVERLAMAPVEQTGGRSFRRARADADMRQAASVSEAEEAMAAMAPPSAMNAHAIGGDTGTPTWTRVGRRIFRLVDAVWVDARLQQDAAELAIEPWSGAWLDLIERFPGLRDAAALGESVIIAGDGLALRLAGGGATVLEDDDWERIERAFAPER